MRYGTDDEHLAKYMAMIMDPETAELVPVPTLEGGPISRQVNMYRTKVITKHIVKESRLVPGTYCFHAVGMQHNGYEDKSAFDHVDWEDYDWHRRMQEMSTVGCRTPNDPSIQQWNKPVFFSDPQNPDYFPGFRPPLAYLQFPSTNDMQKYPVIDSKGRGAMVCAIIKITFTGALLNSAGSITLTQNFARGNYTTEISNGIGPSGASWSAVGKTPATVLAENQQLPTVTYPIAGLISEGDSIFLRIIPVQRDNLKSTPMYSESSFPRNRTGTPTAEFYDVAFTFAINTPDRNCSFDVSTTTITQVEENSTFPRTMYNPIAHPLAPRAMESLQTYIPDPRNRDLHRHVALAAALKRTFGGSLREVMQRAGSVGKKVFTVIKDLAPAALAVVSAVGSEGATIPAMLPVVGGSLMKMVNDIKGWKHHQRVAAPALAVAPAIPQQLIVGGRRAMSVSPAIPQQLVVGSRREYGFNLTGGSGLNFDKKKPESPKETPKDKEEPKNLWINPKDYPLLGADTWGKAFFAAYEAGKTVLENSLSTRALMLESPNQIEEFNHCLDNLYAVLGLATLIVTRFTGSPQADNMAALSKLAVENEEVAKVYEVSRARYLVSRLELVSCIGMESKLWKLMLVKSELLQNQDKLGSNLDDLNSEKARCLREKIEELKVKVASLLGKLA